MYNVTTKYIKLCLGNIYKAPLSIYSRLYVPLALFRKMLSTNDVLNGFYKFTSWEAYPPIPPTP